MMRSDCLGVISSSMTAESMRAIALRVLLDSVVVFGVEMLMVSILIPFFYVVAVFEI